MMPAVSLFDDLDRYVVRLLVRRVPEVMQRLVVECEHRGAGCLVAAVAA